MILNGSSEFVRLIRRRLQGGWVCDGDNEDDDYNSPSHRGRHELEDDEPEDHDLVGLYGESVCPS
jgi:hypothetical protein